MLNVFNQSLWGDEAFSAVLSMKPVTEIISIISRDTSPPLFNLIEHYWFKLAGTGEIAIRTLVFIYFLVTCFFVYKIGTLLWNKKTGLFAAILTFLNPFLFTYGFEGRMYSLLTVTTTASFYFFAKAFLFKNAGLAGYVIATTLALYSHHFAIFAIFVQGLWWLKALGSREWALVKKMIIAFITIAVLYSPWLMPLYNQTKMVTGGFWLGTPNLTDLKELIYKYLAKGLPHKLTNVALYLSVATLILRRWGKDAQKSLFLLSWFLLPILLTWGLSQKIQSIFFDRYLLYTIPAAMLLLASQLRKYSVATLVPLVLIFAIIDFDYFTHPTKRPFRNLANYVKEAKRGDDYLINWNAASHHLWETKYYGIAAPLYIPEGKSLPFYVGTALMAKEDVVSALPKKVSRIGVITSGSVDEATLPGYTKKELKEFGELKFLWYQKSR